MANTRNKDFPVANTRYKDFPVANNRNEDFPVASTRNKFCDKYRKTRYEKTRSSPNNNVNETRVPFQAYKDISTYYLIYNFVDNVNNIHPGGMTKYNTTPYIFF